MIATKIWERLPMNGDPYEQQVDILRQTVIAPIRRESPDLTARQLGVFLTCYLDDEAQTVRGLAAKLSVAKPAITLALWTVSRSSIWCVERPTPWIGAAFWRNERRRAWRSSATSRRYCLTPEVRPTRRPPERGARLLCRSRLAAWHSRRHRPAASNTASAER
jgi:hypothetical protein